MLRPLPTRVWLPLSVLVALVCGSVALAGESPTLRAGAAAVDISPQEFPVNMPGNFGRNMAEGVHDPLHARALVLDDGATLLAMVVVDNLGIGRETADEARALAAERCGIAPENVLVAATHSHSAPPSGVVDGPDAAVAYRKILIEGIAESIVRAHGALRPAAVGHGAHPLPEELFNRIPFPGPALAARIIGEVTDERLNTVRKATTIVENILKNTGAFQYMAILHEDRVTGMVGGKREFGQQIEIRCWDSVDARTATPTNLSFEMLTKLANEIIQQVPGIVSVTYNLAPKPPSTIEAV
jgi:hypothetical protein